MEEEIPPRRLKPREQGDLGEFSAMEWFANQGAHIYLPLGHSPDVDLVVELDDQIFRLQVKTSTQRRRRRWCIMIATRGGNQSWNGVSKYFDPTRCDFLFVHVGDGRRWLIPSYAVDGKAGLILGGSKYAQFEVAPGRPLTSHAETLESTRPGEYRSGQTGRPVKSMALAFAGSNPASPTTRTKPGFRRSRYERKLGQSGQAVINQKRRVTIPQEAVLAAGLVDGDRVRATCDGPGRIILEQLELPAWARPHTAKQPGRPEHLSSDAGRRLVVDTQAGTDEVGESCRDPESPR
jgi:bifunctional DNA-binding transcriptional regulator/antitoxin component of YhaV-PrlF toxin-antitoxin module